MKKDTIDSAVEEPGDIEITDQQLISDWKKKDLRQLSAETGLALDEVNRRLKAILKPEVRRRIDDHA